ncbi:GNAT family N-acetyltransferase [Photobacterium rosenbergii]|uniref:GNAT family N-acetyltransferase n=1 Tax=Photobacterium rosenbergii TaxID=294936 RepID=A0ABU3ZEV4_9GAMM|nr:GNAT family N-acetyltransferase [Photobacterium rosenbergii]MDV5168626.1 GNAT family N-acetyltransferase [Photobacterium rosenbergii]
MALIREMEISDYPQVIKLWSGTEAMLLRDADSQQNIAKYLGRNPGLSFVAVDDANVIGAILVGTDGRRGYIQHIAVSTRYRGQGIGARLISSAVNALEKQGIAKTHLFVANDNLDAQVFYEKLGWFPRDEVRMFSYNSSSENNV